MFGQCLKASFKFFSYLCSVKLKHRDTELSKPHTLSPLRHIILSLLLVCAFGLKAQTTEILDKVFSYQATLRDSNAVEQNVYVRYRLGAEKRNFSLLFIPSMYYIAKGKRDFIGETYGRIRIDGVDQYSTNLQLTTGTIPNNHEAMGILRLFLTPNVYDNTLVGEVLLSPFNRKNRGFYKYLVSPLTMSRQEIVFTPRTRNTQLVSGRAVVDSRTGRIQSVEIRGEWDMISFYIRAKMGDKGLGSLLPKKCEMTTLFRFMGNRISSNYVALYGSEATLNDSIRQSHDKDLMDSIRPLPLTGLEKELYERYFAQKAYKDSISKEQNNGKKSHIWSNIGESLTEKIRGRFGSEEQGEFRISPLFNPLYLSYSRKKGITYRMNMRFGYAFSENMSVGLNLKMGYSFKQHQLYYRLPIRLMLNKRKNTFLEVEIGNGNRISSSQIVEQLKKEHKDSIDFKLMNLDYFRGYYIKSSFNVDFNEHFSLTPTLTYHHRKALKPKRLEAAGKETEYYSIAPGLQFRYRPLGYSGAVFSTDYERGISGILQSKTSYERFEVNMSWKKKYNSLRFLSIKTGGGFYSVRSSNTYFLDYVNFREETVPDGWEDEWTGEFQLLNSNWYNASKYYARVNATYESPLMLLSRIPLAGRYIETERIYANILCVKRLYPYLELGYGFTNRLFSMGAFVSISHQGYEGIGARFALELFRDW